METKQTISKQSHNLTTLEVCIFAILNENHFYEAFILERKGNCRNYRMFSVSKSC